MSRVVVKRSGVVARRCERCGKPTAVLAGRNVHFSGVPGLGLTEAGDLVVRSRCDHCHQPYEIEKPEGLIPRLRVERLDEQAG